MWRASSVVVAVVIAVCYTLCVCSNAQHLDADKRTLANEVFKAIGENPSLLSTLNSELELENVVLDGEITPQQDNSSECMGCIAFMTTINRITNLPGPGYPAWRLTIIATCKQILEAEGVNGDLVCAGICDSYGPHVFDIFRAREHDNRYICEFLNQCDPPELFDPVPAHAKPVLKTAPALSEQKIKVVPEDAIKAVLVSDVHVEHRYVVGGPTDCDTWICCRDDVSGTGSARQWGEHTCNTAPHTLEIFLSQIPQLEPDFVLYGGDGPPHSLWDENQVKHLNSTSWIAKKFEEHIPGVSIYPTLGNHDGYPANLYYIPREETQEQNRYFYNDWETVAGFGPEQKATIEYSGFYTVEIMPGLRMLAYNSNYGYTDDWYNLLSEHEDVIPSMFQFMVDTLQAARDNGEKVVMFGHIASGSNIIEFDEKINEIIISYSDVITLMPNGHTHSTEFRIVIDQETGEPHSVFYIGGALTTGPNPSVTVYYFDPVTFELLDYDIYYNHIDDQNPEIEPQLTFMLRATEEYGLADLSPASWLDLTFRFEEDDELFQDYYRNRRARVDPDSFCDSGCKESTLCSIRTADYLNRRRCQEGL